MASAAMLWSQNPFHGLGTGLTSSNSADWVRPEDFTRLLLQETYENNFTTSTVNPFGSHWTYLNDQSFQDNVPVPGPRIVELDATDDCPYACDVCGRCFGAAKSVLRHKRTVHRPVKDLKLKCYRCGLECKRKDTLDRHVRERHAELEEKVECRLCGKKIGRRSYRSHQKSSACKNSSQLDHGTSRQVDIVIRPHSERNLHLATPVYLDAIADPVILAAELFVRFKPWGPDNGWLDPFHHPDTAQPSGTIEVMELKGVLLRTIIRAMSSPYVSRDPSIVDAMAILLIFIVQAEGWTASRVHTQGFVMLAAMQIEAAQSESQFVHDTAGDVFHTVVLRNVADPDVSRCETMIKMAIALMRYAAAENIRSKNLKVANRGQPEWDTVLEIDPNWWFEYYRPKLLPIAEVASTPIRDKL